MHANGRGLGTVSLLRALGDTGDLAVEETINGGRSLFPSEIGTYCCVISNVYLRRAKRSTKY